MRYNAPIEQTFFMVSLYVVFIWWFRVVHSLICLIVTTLCSPTTNTLSNCRLTTNTIPSSSACMTRKKPRMMKLWHPVSKKSLLRDKLLLTRLKENLFQSMNCRTSTSKLRVKLVTALICLCRQETQQQADR